MQTFRANSSAHHDGERNVQIGKGAQGLTQVQLHHCLVR
jgi:hypothetical protein